jgi:cytochrome c oxidase cbb3-type subunit III
MHPSRCEIILVCAAALLCCNVRLEAATASGASPNSDHERGQRMFAMHCARCHGMQGFGGTGPNLARPQLTHASDLAGIIAIIENGIPGTAMPSTWLLPRKDREAVAIYVQSLGKAVATPVHGNPARGGELFTKAACAQCHTIAGLGGVRGPDLTDVGSRRGTARLRQMLLEPGAEKTKSDDGFTEYLPVKITTVSGKEVEGLRINEDTFTIQLRDLENRIHSFRKSEVKQVSKGFGQSIMPSFASMFSAGDLDDLVAYLASLKIKK